MNKTKGSPYIATGSIGMMVLAGLGMLISPFIIALSSWLGNLFSRYLITASGRLPDSNQLAGGLIFRFLGGLGIAYGIFLLLISILQLVFGIMTWKKRDDLAHTSFSLAVGVAFTALSLPLAVTGLGLIQLAFPVLVMVGASMNRQQHHEMRSFYSSQPAPLQTDENKQG